MDTPTPPTIANSSNIPLSPEAPPSKNDNLEATAEILLDKLIYGKLNEFENILKELQEINDSQIVDLIKYMFEFYVKKDD